MKANPRTEFPAAAPLAAPVGMIPVMAGEQENADRSFPGDNTFQPKETETEHQTRNREEGIPSGEGKRARSNDDGIGELRCIREEAGKEMNTMPPVLIEETEDPYRRIAGWRQVLGRVIRSGVCEERFDVLAASAGHFRVYRRSGPREFAWAVDWMEYVRPLVISEPGRMAVGESGELDPQTAEIGGRVAAAYGFEREPDWGGRYMPLEGAGLPVACPEIAGLVESLPDAVPECLLRAAKADVFFQRYVDGGNGQAVLKEEDDGNEVWFDRGFERLLRIAREGRTEGEGEEPGRGGKEEGN